MTDREDFARERRKLIAAWDTCENDPERYDADFKYRMVFLSLCRTLDLLSGEAQEIRDRMDK